MKPIKIHNQILDESQSDYLILAGPTAVGKTDTVVSLSDEHDIEIISGDSRQIYKFMNIGTATPESELLERLPHHLLNELTPDIVWNAADFYQRARQIIKEVLGRGKLAVVVGGAGMYLDALRFGLFEEQHKDPAIRQKYQDKVDAGEAESLWNQLMELDPEYAGTFHFNNFKKLMRAFEIYESSGMIPSEAFSNSTDPFEKQGTLVVLDRDRKLLYERINHRVMMMLENGLIQECQTLLDRGYKPDLYPMRTIGYKEVYAFLNGEIDESKMIDSIQQNTRNFAKRQLTWFRNHSFDYWIDLGS
ncbi:MAG: tRNA (adenosine(37)-N6)-dimethylallyltransferase MiaA [Candidatus Marinimicrobia bacterium]|jgi:tRNA dimethylallyltransferase|nr:tRNA (adenosine(37)-N6)-dimethylallyltransferase MiaA [Candidatus Neomarinimicrobiota bacterium]MBT3577166.1 tRNA (adenosine(37)-N6)-dimethylallyltransferase MiaA [Candidatus Neomarinimicrobiota bacterium]MBT3679522.1 tRNA (adenosine(37)-N6)-dimethylallyltransferase MiaA [Candidatus Neomarinimicrobiota bacterium]MBT3950678.1 tRNA (adenosine(37)-N6)-dimethylallyltransferase MiaA [Candidatus Neomarinimicrobiota bacterium]MBT4252246.1 tRNA (adenosine(37)-N6)-dimethylallyltransferase MiaA [Candi